MDNVVSACEFVERRDFQNVPKALHIVPHMPVEKTDIVEREDKRVLIHPDQNIDLRDRPQISRQSHRTAENGARLAFVNAFVTV